MAALIQKDLCGNMSKISLSTPQLIISLYIIQFLRYAHFYEQSTKGIF